ncbi:MAG TPA: DNA replication and repair protein RecF [Gemmatimonadales bacterium]|nr:DNA replication and repair protein RecF [Gemmatimonadales bacterium]
MWLRRLVARGYRNLAELDREAPASGLVLLGANAQGKTNLLEAIYYPVLFRSFRGATDGQVLREPSGFSVEVHLAGGTANTVGAAYAARKKRITIDGAEVERLADSVGTWLAVTFLPSDVGLASGPAAERRQYLDRVLSLSDRRYLRALGSYRSALAQRNSALRQGRTEVAQAFNRPLSAAGAALVRSRLDWAAGAAEQFPAELESLGEEGKASLHYRGRLELADPEAWKDVLADSLSEDCARSVTTAGPHRDDLVLEVEGRRLRDYGSTGQQRSAAIALKLIEITSLRTARGTEPALLLDDVFAELDRERQSRLATRLLEGGERQVFVTSPRRDELPANLDLPVWVVEQGRVRS